MKIRAILFTALLLLGAGGPLSAGILSMSQDRVRAELIGPQLQGNYADGLAWQEKYFKDGRITYSDKHNKWQGKWSFRGSGFCTFYNGDMNGGCWDIQQTSANCYEFYPMTRNGKPLTTRPGVKRGWVAKGWRSDVASTCEIDVGV